MWSGYAENHKGIALRIEGNVDKASKFELFKPVTYREKRPSLYDGGLDYLKSSLFADQEASKRAMMDKICGSAMLSDIALAASPCLSMKQNPRLPMSCAIKDKSQVVLPVPVCPIE
jgi:hypothetical protein